ncbi:MAG: hypothetical protein E6R03_14720 [Hyphomicrobiaceae bacterium]|nr:MAG: hypothetical protein E6R03_14720 [Hyphomicrobiaceae bacterium]
MSKKLQIIEALIPHGTPSRSSIGGRTIELSGSTSLKGARRFADRRADQIEAHLKEQDISVRCYGGNLLHRDDGRVLVELNLIGEDGEKI